MIYLIEDLKAVTKGKLSATISTIFLGQSLFLWDWIKLSQSIENQEHLSI